MRFSTLNALVAVGAGAVAALTTSKLHRRAQDGVYLANCLDTSTGVPYSEFAYYNNAVGGSQNQQLPDGVAYAATSDPRQSASSDVVWEQPNNCGLFVDT